MALWVAVVFVWRVGREMRGAWGKNMVFRMALWVAVVFVWRMGRVMRGAWGKKGAGAWGIIIADTECHVKCSVT